MVDPSALTVDATIVDGECIVQATNSSRRTIHVFDWDDMPYLLRDDGGLLVLHGMHEPPPESNYWGIEIPSTRPLEVGEVLVGSVALDPLWVHSHYGTGDPIGNLDHPTRLRTAVGWGLTPLDDHAIASMSVSMVCHEWQHLAHGPELSLP